MPPQRRNQGFKFSFPLPRRKSSSDKQPGTSLQRMYSDDADDFPLSSPGAKAEEVLGTSTPNCGFGDKPRINLIRKYPSFMSVTISDAGSDSVRGDDEVWSGMSTPGDLAYERPYITRDLPSSPLLGQSFTTSIKDRGSASNTTIPQAHCSPSSTTLRSYYDPAKSPLAVSQQTSDSSVRDMALRKGLPSVSSPLAQEASELTLSVDPHSHSSEGQPEPSKKRPPRIDLSSVFPRPRSIDPPLNSPHLITKSPPRMSLISSNHKSTSGRPKWFGWERKKSKPTEVHDSQRLPSIPPPGDEPSAYKLHVFQANEPVQDGINGAGQDVAQGTADSNAEYGIALTPQAAEYTGTPLKVGHAQSAPGKRSRSRNSSFGNYSHRSVYSARSASLRMETNSTARHPQNRSIPSNCEIRSSPSTASRPSVRSGHERGDTLATMDLLNQSVLSLSSSEDESEESATIEFKLCSRRVGESIDYADKSEETQVINARKVTPVKPRPITSSRSRQRSTSSGTEQVPPVPSIPARPHLSPRVSSMKWQEHQNIRSALDHYADSGTLASEDMAKGFRLSDQSRVSGSGSKMMAVTPDEERLLEGMRRKRASIRQDVFAESFGKGAIQPRDFISRPRTAGADESRARGFDVEMRRAPPNVPDDLARSLCTPYAASVDDLTHGVDFVFPQVPDVPARLRNSLTLSSPPKQSPSLSFSASDLLPSTPTSRRSPITPPPGMGYLDAQSTSYAVSPSRPLYPINKNKHARKSTVSSSVVVLDGGEQRAQQLDEEDEITGWAIDRW